MTREIKFRGKKFCQDEWIYGSLITRGERGADGNFIDTGRGECYPIQQDTIGQFTGLKDKNGKEIYEGDIVEYTYTFIRDRGYKPQEHTKKGYIVYLEQEAGYVLVLPKSDLRIGERNISGNDLNVISNLYDNPELLKGGNVWDV